MGLKNHSAEGGKLVGLFARGGCCDCATWVLKLREAGSAIVQPGFRKGHKVRNA